MTLVAFLERLLKTSSAMTTERRDLISTLLDTGTKRAGSVRKSPQEPKPTQNTRTRKTARRLQKR